MSFSSRNILHLTALAAKHKRKKGIKGKTAIGFIKEKECMVFSISTWVNKTAINMKLIKIPTVFLLISFFITLLYIYADKWAKGVQISAFFIV